MTRRVLHLAALVAAPAAFTLAGCGEDDGNPCVQSLCDAASHGAVCVGHAVQTCAADGRSFVYTACGAQQRCAGGVCVARECTSLGEATCLSPTTVERCRDDGSGYDSIPCGAEDICKDGACVPSVCAGAGDRCTNGGFVTCTDAAWVQENCPVGQLCELGGSGAARCVPKACPAETRRCDGDSVRICDARGGAETVLACASGEVCVDGVCQAAVCGGGGATDADITDGVDTIDTAETSEPDSEILFTLGGVATTLGQSAFATFDAGDRRLTVKASQSLRSLEIRFEPANATVSGAFSSEVFNPIKVLVCYDSGQSPADFSDCEGFTHRSTAYAVTVTRNDGPGGRFEATFTATLEDQNTDTIQLQSGQINVKYR